MSDQTLISGLLDDLRHGDPEAFPKLIPVVYSELRRLAARYLKREKPDHSLQTTDLVHEAYLRLAGREEKKWQNRAHFFAIAAGAMRGILVDHARARKALKRGGANTRIQLDEPPPVAMTDHDDLLVLDKALSQLAKIDPRQSRIVELRYFAGMSVAEVAVVLGTSERTVLRNWKVAKAWLYAEVQQSGNLQRTPRDCG